jgi:alanine racemase
MARTHKSRDKGIRRPVWAEVSIGALEYNLQAIRKYVNPPEEKRKTSRKILSIVKGNGYGHGGPEVAKALEKAGSDWFGVTCTDEGIAVRNAGVRKPILILTSFVPGEEPQLIEHDLTAAIHRCEQLAILERAAARRGSKKPVPFHLKIDTGMNRLGIASTDIECFARQLGKCKHLQLTGIFSHFASSEVFTNSAVGQQTREQEERFYRALERLRTLGIDPGSRDLGGYGAAGRDSLWLPSGLRSHGKA